MQPLKGEKAPPRDAHSRPSRAWKKKYKCHKLKGDHNFELVKPQHARNNFSYMSVAEYYIMEDAKDKKNKWPWGKMRYYQCVACGKHDYKWDHEPKITYHKN